MAGLLWYRSYMDSLANTSGYYPDIHAGHADRVAVLTLDAPYLIRETPAGYNQLELMKLVGGSVVWSQLCNSSSVTGTSGHKFYLKKSGVESITNTNTFTGLASGTDMVTDLTQMLGPTIADYVYSLEQATAGSGIAWLKKYDLIDDQYHAYSQGSLESVNVSAHVMVGFNQWDEAWETGTIDVNTGEDVASNARIRCKNQIPIFPNTEYAFTIASETGRFDTFRVVYYDASGQYISGTAYFPQGGYATSPILFTTPANAFFMRFSTPTVYGETYKGDICINLSKTTGTPKNGDYVPYWSETTPLANVTLRGIPKLNNGNLYYDGDTYEWDGTVTRYFDTRAYQAGDESLPDAITDGTNTVYKLGAPTTESADPYTAVQDIEEGGTEEFVTGNNVPVGNVSVYRRA